VTRILGGEFRGRRLEVAASKTRPSTGRLREALFSVLLPRIESARVVDLFAGAGSLGFEALSRGAASALFVENHPAALRALAANARRLGLGPERAQIFRGDAHRWIDRQLRREPAAFEIVFADPPYQDESLSELLSQGRSLVESGRVGCFCLEHSSRFEVDVLSGDGYRQQTRRYGQSAFTLVEGKSA